MSRRLPVIHGDPQERSQIEHLDWAGLRQARRSKAMVNRLKARSLWATIPIS